MHSKQSEGKLEFQTTKPGIVKSTKSQGGFRGAQDGRVEVPVGKKRHPVAGAEVGQPEVVAQFEGSAEQTPQRVEGRLERERE